MKGTYQQIGSTRLTAHQTTLRKVRSLLKILLPLSQLTPTYAGYRYRPTIIKTVRTLPVPNVYTVNRFDYVITYSKLKCKATCCIRLFSSALLFAQPQLINATLFFFSTACSDVETIFEHRQLTRSFIVHCVPTFTADSWSHAVTVRLRSTGSRDRSPPPIRGHRSRSSVSNHRDEYTHRSAHRQEQRTISRTHAFRRDSPSDNLKTNRRVDLRLFPLMHVHATIPLRRSILQLHPNHLWRLHTTTRLHLMYGCRRHVLRHPTWNLTTRSQHVFLPHQSCQIHNSSPTQLLFLQNLPSPHTVSKPAKVYNCTSCKRTLTSASGWYKHRRFFHGLQTPDKYLIFVLQPHRQPIQM
jgi:hypothetical protein